MLTDAYVNKEQDKFFRRVNRQQADIDALKEWMEQSELRAKALELEVEENEVVIPIPPPVSMPLATLVQTSLGLYRSPTGPGW